MHQFLEKKDTMNRIALDENAIKLTIITINYNNNVGLIKTIESIITQTWMNFEFIVIDGGSTDESLETIKKYDKYINYWVSEKDKGVYDAMNKGILLAKGTYLNFMNSGDYFYSKTILEEIHHKFEQNVSVLYGDAVFFSPESKDRIIKLPLNLTFSHFVNDALCHQASFIKRDLFFKYFLYSLNYKIVSDWAFFVYLLCKKNESYEHLKKIICYYDYTGLSSIVENVPTSFLERKIFFKKHFPLFFEDFENFNIKIDRRILKVFIIKENKILWTILKIFISIFIFLLPKNK